MTFIPRIDSYVHYLKMAKCRTGKDSIQATPIGSSMVIVECVVFFKQRDLQHIKTTIAVKGSEMNDQ